MEITFYLLAAMMRCIRGLRIPWRRNLSSDVRIVEVGPRDGLQNIKSLVPTNTKIKLIDGLSESGLKFIESTSFVSPKWIPQLADNREVLSSINRTNNVVYTALIPNVKGLEGAIECGIKEITLFTAASETFSKRNTNCSIEESFERFKKVLELAKANGISVRCAVSCVVGCPYEGEVNPIKVADICKELISIGCYEVGLADTIGVGTAGSFKKLLTEVTKNVPNELLALHCHDTFGQAITNCYVGLQHGIRTFESSVSGLGGCPYAEGATGNVATEDLVYMLHGAGYSTGVDLNKLIDVGNFISEALQRVNLSRVATATLAKREKEVIV